MQYIATLNGRQFLVESSLQLTQEQVNSYAAQNIQTGCASCGGGAVTTPPDRVLKMSPATCPTSVIQGTTHPVTINATGGVAPYTYTLLLGGVTKATSGPIPGATWTTNVTFSEPVGSYTLVGQIVDSCGTPQTATDACPSFSITAPPVLTTISISGCGTAIMPGATCALTASCRDQYSATIVCGTLTWQSSNPSVATVSSTGVVTGIVGGSVTITARNATGTVVSNPISVTVSCNVLGVVMTIGA